MAVIKDGRTYTVRIQLPRDPTTGRRSQYVKRGFAREADAKRHEREQIRGQEKGRDLRGGRLSFGAYLTDEWLPAIDADTKLKPSTRAHYRRMAKHLIDGLGTTLLVDLTGNHLTALYGQMRDDDYAEATVRHVHVTARKALGAARRRVEFNAADDATSPAQPRGKPKSYTPEQVGAFLAMAEADRWAPLWRLAATSGKRRGEVVGIRWSDLDLDRGEWTVMWNAVVVDHVVVETTTKSDRVKRISLDAQTVAALRAWRKRQLEERVACGGEWPGGDRVWTWQDGGSLHPDTVTRTWKRLRDRTGLPALRLHHLRHSWATNALNNGAHVKHVADRLDHSSTRITLDMYVEATPEADRQLADAMANLYDSAGG